VQQLVLGRRHTVLIDEARRKFAPQGSGTFRHAGPAVTATVQLRYHLDDDVEIEVTDNGHLAARPQPGQTNTDGGQESSSSGLVMGGEDRTVCLADAHGSD